MNFYIWRILLQFLILFPAAISCYLPIKNQMKYTFKKTALLCTSIIILCSFLGIWLHLISQIDINIIFFVLIIIFFFLYRRTVKIDFSKALAIYVGVCAIETFPAQFAYSFDASLHPLSGASNFSIEAALFQFGLSWLLVIAFTFPACHQFAWIIEHMNFPKIWYTTVALSSIFLIFNIICVPKSYSTLHTGRMFFLFPALEVCALALLIAIYVFFYQSSVMLLKHIHLKEHSHLLEIQAHEYQILQEHMKQTKRLRHDFRHSVHLLAALAKKGDLDSIQTYLEEYENRLAENTIVNYCSNSALDALFSYYHEIAVSNGILVNWKIELPTPLTVSELDMANLFGNLIENAIAGCLGNPQEQRCFSLTTEIRYGNTLYIVSTNSFNGQTNKREKEYYSTKHSGKGIGIASITAVVEKYHGSVQVSNSTNEFFVDVIMKI